MSDFKGNLPVDCSTESMASRKYKKLIVNRWFLYLQLSKNERIGVEALHAVYVTSKPPQNLGDKELYDILIELSSPLTGYLGRIKEDYWKKDRFYYLRDLPIN